MRSTMSCTKYVACVRKYESVLYFKEVVCSAAHPGSPIDNTSRATRTSMSEKPAIAARMPIITTAIMSSMSVKPKNRVWFILKPSQGKPRKPPPSGWPEEGVILAFDYFRLLVVPESWSARQGTLYAWILGATAGADNTRGAAFTDHDDKPRRDATADTDEPVNIAVAIQVGVTRAGEIIEAIEAGRALGRWRTNARDDDAAAGRCIGRGIEHAVEHGYFRQSLFAHPVWRRRLLEFFGRAVVKIALGERRGRRAGCAVLIVVIAEGVDAIMHAVYAQGLRQFVERILAVAAFNRDEVIIRRGGICRIARLYERRRVEELAPFVFCRAAAIITAHAAGAADVGEHVAARAAVFLARCAARRVDLVAEVNAEHLSARIAHVQAIHRAVAVAVEQADIGGDGVLHRGQLQRRARTRAAHAPHERAVERVHDVDAVAHGIHAGRDGGVLARIEAAAEDEHGLFRAGRRGYGGDPRVRPGLAESREIAARAALDAPQEFRRDADGGGGVGEGAGGRDVERVNILPAAAHADEKSYLVTVGRFDNPVLVVVHHPHRGRAVRADEVCGVIVVHECFHVIQELGEVHDPLFLTAGSRIIRAVDHAQPAVVGADEDLGDGAGGRGARGNGDRRAGERIRAFPAVGPGRALAVVVLHVLAAHPIYDRGAFGGRAGAQHGLGDDRVGIGHHVGGP